MTDDTTCPGFGRWHGPTPSSRRKCAECEGQSEEAMARRALKGDRKASHWSMEQWMNVGARSDLVNWIRRKSAELGIPQGHVIDQIVRPVMEQEES